MNEGKIVTRIIDSKPEGRRKLEDLKINRQSTTRCQKSENLKNQLGYRCLENKSDVGHGPVRAFTSGMMIYDDKFS